VVTPVADCCARDADCAPADACTDVRCDVGRHRCAGERDPQCCGADADCAQPGLCVQAYCDGATSRCATRAVAGCCVLDADCPAPTGCTAFACTDGGCSEVPIPGCCARDVDCAAGQGCDQSRCQALSSLDRDGDGSAADVDCDDRDADRHPGATERCDGSDADCDGLVDADDPDCAPPPPRVDFAAIQYPVDPVTVCEDRPSPLLFARVYAAGRTPGAGHGAGVDAEAGFGPRGSDPAADAGWSWVPGLYNRDLRNNFDQLNDDEYRAELPAIPAGQWDVAWRFRLDGGPWTYADRPPNGSNDGYHAADALQLSTVGDCPPPPAVGFADLEAPVDPIEVCPGQAIPPIFGRVWVDGRTPGAGRGAGVEALLGYGPDGSDPQGAGWQWFSGDYDTDLRNQFDQLNDDQYRAVLSEVAPGAWDVAWRFRVDGGPWTYADLRPGGTGDGYDPAQSLSLTVREACAPAP
jgi:hypothetical protein